ncbi:ATP-dependent helicase [Arthrobacter russicus]
MVSMSTTALDLFSAPTRAWFQGAFAGPTPAQTGAWEAIAAGSHALVVAPTGSGKTLAAFLWSLDSLIRDPENPGGPGTKVLYISPLKALGVDVERNLRAPLIGLRQQAEQLGLPVPEVSVGVRSGDTPANERRKLLSHPPEILITTPESLFLMLTSQARKSLQSVRTVIIDEVHAVAGTKRGAHLAVSLERLDALLTGPDGTGSPAQRVGLSATVEPLETVARFLTGSAPCRIVAPPASKTWDLQVTVPVEDMSDLASAAAAHDLGPGSGLQPNASIWPHVEEKIVDLVTANRSTIVFANSRRLAERLTGRLNEIYLARQLPEPEAEAESAAQLPAGQPPAQLIGQAGLSAGADPVLAKAHHGSVSKEQRALIEDDLKSGRLRCVVATSSLELGIDMGLVDLVIQVESPPSVASGLQRVGRAGHQVGEVSQGVLFPKHRADLVHATVTVERMLAGQIEPLYIPANPLDILAQQTVAATALGSLDVEEWFDTVRRSAPFSALPRSAFDATLDLLAGRYPSDDFAELRPRIIWDRNAGTITGRPGAQRLAVTSGGTIPDRGLFGVYLVGAEEGKNSRRVGELDEEMVYESRVGDVFALGATSWRIEDITHDRVLVSPAFGQPGRLPFWKGDSLGRPVELGRAIGAFMRQVSAAPKAEALARCRKTGLDDYAANNLLGYLAEQAEATGSVPDDRTLLVERFQDELGDWRVVLHSPFGMPVHAPWALAVGARLQERYGLDGSAMAADDGIVLRVPMMDDEPPGADLFIFEPDELESIVTDQVGGSALFASRFRECAARALLLPRQNPAKRSPLWQQRQRSAQLLDVAKKYPSFPIILETVRECLQDVYDLPALKGIASALERRELRLTETTTQQPSPFARSLLFGYVASFLYEGDSPLAERRAAALSLDPALLNELLGRAELRELLDQTVIDEVSAELQRTAVGRKARGLEGVADLLRQLGPLSAEQVAQRLAVDQRPESGPGTVDPGLADATGWLADLVRSNRAFRSKVAGEPVFAAVEDAARLRDALGVPLPMGIPLAFIEPVADPLGDLVSRYARSHGPFLASEAAAALGLGVAVLSAALERLASDGKVVQGEFRPVASPGEAGGLEWCDAQVLRRIRQRSLAALRAEVEPVDRAAFGRFLPSWQHVGSGLRGHDGVLTVIDQLAGVPIPASAIEPLVLASRVRDYAPGMLDELMAAGEVLWSGMGSLPGNDGWIALHAAESLPLTLRPAADYEPAGLAADLLAFLAPGGAYFFQQLRIGLESAELPSDQALTAAIWELVWAGRLGNDTFAPVRAMLDGGHTAHQQKARPARLRPARLGGRYAGLAKPAQPALQPMVGGRWSALGSTGPELDPTIRAHATAELLLDRYGVLTRGPVALEGEPGGFALMYKVLSRLEEQGRCRRGYFIEKLGAAQFAVPATVDRLRSFSTDFTEDKPPYSAVALAATDPAQPYGAALAWPGLEAAASGHRPGRKAGALVVLVDGSLVLYVERGGKTVLCFSEELPVLESAAAALVALVKRGAADRLAMEKVNGTDILDTSLAKALLAGGAATSPRGIRIRA